MYQPTTIEEVQTIVRTTQAPLTVRGGGSKPALSAQLPNSVTLHTDRLSGILAYDAGEYTFTAYAGTLVRDIANALAEHGQYLPFDPILVAQGATLGGVVAANTSGSGRYRYGGVRDFILGVRFVDGNGELVRGGGKVVKNSAGFDLPKFMVGSLGRYGVLVELTFKVFPQPAAYTTLMVRYATIDDAVQAVYAIAPTPFEMDALDVAPGPDGAVRLIVRLGGLPNALDGRVQRLRTFLEANTLVVATEQLIEEADYWQAVNRFAWADANAPLIKVPLTPKRIGPLLAATTPHAYRATVGGHVLWLSGVDSDAADQQLSANGLAGLQLWSQMQRGVDRPILGKRKGAAFAKRVKQALDPHGKLTQRI